MTLLTKEEKEMVSSLQEGSYYGQIGITIRFNNHFWHECSGSLLAGACGGDNLPTLVKVIQNKRRKKVRRMTYGIDQQGGKGCANFTEEVFPTICSDSHGTPHGIAQVIKRGMNPIVLNFMGCKSNNAVTQDGSCPTITRMHGNDVHVVCLTKEDNC